MGSNINDASKKHKIFKCPDCPKKYKSSNLLYNHVERVHKDLIPDNNTVKQYVFNRRNKKTTGRCVICKKPTQWNEDIVRYERYCSDKCKKIARERFKKNAKRKLGTSNPASTSEHQMKAIAGRHTSGEYEFTTGGKVGYSSSYEKDFLRFCDEELHMKSLDIMQCEIIFDYEMDGRVIHHIPDYFIPNFNLIIQIKFGGNNPNHSAYADEAYRRQAYADEAIIKNNQYNYVKIVNMEYDGFINVLDLIKECSSSMHGCSDVIINIPGNPEYGVKKKAF